MRSWLRTSPLSSSTPTSAGAPLAICLAARSHQGGERLTGPPLPHAPRGRRGGKTMKNTWISCLGSTERAFLGYENGCHKGGDALKSLPSRGRRVGRWSARWRGSRCRRGPPAGVSTRAFQASYGSLKRSFLEVSSKTGTL